MIDDTLREEIRTGRRIISKMIHVCVGQNPKVELVFVGGERLFLTSEEVRELLALVDATVLDYDALMRALD